MRRSSHRYARCPWTSPWPSPSPPGPSGSGPGRGRAQRRADRCCSCTGCRPTPGSGTGSPRRLAEDGHPVVAVDLRGHGSSAEVPDPTDGPGATLVAAADLAAVCDRPRLALADRGRAVVGRQRRSAARRRPPRAGGTGWRSSTAAGCTSATGGPRSTPRGRALAPPVLDGCAADDVRGRLLAAHPDWSDGGGRGDVGEPAGPRGRHASRRRLERRPAPADRAEHVGHRPRELSPRRVDVPHPAAAARSPTTPTRSVARTAARRGGRRRCRAPQVRRVPRRRPRPARAAPGEPWSATFS